MKRAQPNVRFLPVTERCNHLDNLLIAKVLHTSVVEGTGFIPVLPTADKIQSKYPAAARVGINHTLPAAGQLS